MSPRTALPAPCTVYPTISNEKAGASQGTKDKLGFMGTGARKKLLTTLPHLPLSVCVCVCIRTCWCNSSIGLSSRSEDSFIHSFNKYLLSSYAAWRSRATLTVVSSERRGESLTGEGQRKKKRRSNKGNEYGKLFQGVLLYVNQHGGSSDGAFHNPLHSQKEEACGGWDLVHNGGLSL